MLSFLQEKFGKVNILEYYQTFYRFKIDENVKLSKVFGEIERNVRTRNLLKIIY